MTRDAVLLAGGLVPLCGGWRQPMLTGVVDNCWDELRIVSIVRMHRRPQHRRDERRHENTGDERTPRAEKPTG